MFLKCAFLVCGTLLYFQNDSHFIVNFSLSLENELYPIGLESYVIPDSQITASSMLSTNPPHHGRLNFPNSWCAASTVSQWLQIDLGRVLRVTRITTKGSYGRSSKDMVSVYLLSYANQSSSSFEFIQNGAVNKVCFHNSLDCLFVGLGTLQSLFECQPRVKKTESCTMERNYDSREQRWICSISSDLRGERGRYQMFHDIETLTLEKIVCI